MVYATGDVTGESLRAQLTDRLASFAIPSRWRIQDAPLPTGHSGKIDKTAIAVEAGAALLRDTDQRPAGSTAS